MWFRNGGMLTGDEIERQIRKGNIIIDPFDPDHINPNSYNLCLHPQILIYSRNGDRSCELPTGEIDPVKDFINREHARLDIEKKEEYIPLRKLSPNATISASMSTFLSVERFNEARLSDLDLHPIDMMEKNETISFNIPETGYVLRPGVLYIGRTEERTFTEKYIPMLDGRSSGGRLGISVHICAGFGDVGFDGTWTLEITVVEPVIVYPHTQIAQVSYFKPCGKIGRKYEGRYFGQIDATASRFYRKV